MTEAISDGPGGRNGKENLKTFIERFHDGGYQSVRKEFEKEKKNLPPLVPETLCFDETWQMIGATVPIWPDQPRIPPWGAFFTRTRDARILGNVMEHDIKRASRKLNDLKSQLSDGGVSGLSCSQWNQLQKAFQGIEIGRMHRLQQHVWQAVYANFAYKDQCRRCRCYFNATLVQENNPNAGTMDCEKDLKRCGACAETCLYSEYLEFLLENIRKSAKKTGRKGAWRRCEDSDDEWNRMLDEACGAEQDADGDGGAEGRAGDGAEDGERGRDGEE